MKITFVISLHHLEIKENLGRGDKLGETAFLSNDISLLNRIIPHGAIEGMGLLERRSLDENKVFIYSTEEVSDDTDPEVYLIDKLFATQSFISVIWIHKDNNIDFELGFVFHETKGKVGMCSNFLNSANTLASGKRKITVLSREELRKTRKFYLDWKFDKQNLQEKYSYQRKRTTNLLKENSRIEIALYHTSAARYSSDLGMKVAHYCSSFEALFSSSQAELSHQLSERLAFFIGKGKEDRLSIYKNTKYAYNIRSKVVHGATIKARDTDKLTRLSIFCDESLRLVYLKLLSDSNVRKIFEGKEELLNEYMLSLIFQ